MSDFRDDNINTNHNASNHDKNDKLSQNPATTIFESEENKEKTEEISEHLVDETPRSCQENVNKILRRIFDLVGERAHSYHVFETALKAFRKDHTQTAYDASCSSIMPVFQAVSTSLRKNESYLRQYSESWSNQFPQIASEALEYANMINTIQNLEKEKLQLTTKVHMLHITFDIKNNDVWNDEYRQSIALLSRGLEEINENLNEFIDIIRQKLIDLTEN